MSHLPPDPDRRSFVKKAGTLIIGGVAVVIPAGAGVAVFLDPALRRTQSEAKELRLTTLDALPADGVPRKFEIIAGRTDAWNKYPDAPIGAVYVRRTAEKKVEALNAVCPHAGCFVDYLSNRNQFLCPCHNSSFALDGRIADPKSPTPRAMDSLPVEIRNESEVWVKFQNFHAGRAEKIPIA